MSPLTFQNQFNAFQTWKNIVDIFLAGCPQRRHSRLLTVFESSFTGKEALTYLFEALLINPYTQEKLTTEQTVKLLEAMLKEKVFVRIGCKKNEAKIFKLAGIYRFAAKRKVSEESIEVARCTQTPLSTVTQKPLMNKVDLWNCYSTSFQTRLYQFFPADFFFSLDVQGSTVWKNCEGETVTDLFQETVQSQINYLNKLPFSQENPNAVKVFNELSDFFSKTSFLTEKEAMAILDIFDEISSGNFYGKVEESLMSAVSLLLLTLPSQRRGQLETVLRLMKKISRDDPRCLVLDHLVKCLVSSTRISPDQIQNIALFFLSNIEELFIPDQDFLRLVEEEKEKILQQRIVLVPVPVKKETKVPRRRNELFDVISILGDIEREEECQVQKKVTVKRVVSFKRKPFFCRVFQKN